MAHDAYAIKGLDHTAVQDISVMARVEAVTRKILRPRSSSYGCRMNKDDPPFGETGRQAAAGDRSPTRRSARSPASFSTAYGTCSRWFARSLDRRGRKEPARKNMLSISRVASTPLHATTSIWVSAERPVSRSRISSATSCSRRTSWTARDARSPVRRFSCTRSRPSCSDWQSTNSP